MRRLRAIPDRHLAVSARMSFRPIPPPGPHTARAISATDEETKMTCLHQSRFSALLAAVLLFATSARALGSELWPELPLPPKAKVEWVGDSMRVNGVPMRVMHFESRAGRSEIVEYYRAYWSGGYETRPSVRPLGD